MPRKKANKKAETNTGTEEVVVEEGSRENIEKSEGNGEEQSELDGANEASEVNGENIPKLKEKSLPFVTPKSTPKSTPRKPPPKPTKSKSKKFTGDGFVEKSDHTLKNVLIEVAIVALSLWFVKLAPVPEKDVQKPPSASFLSLYMTGKLDVVGHIDQILIAAALSVFFDTIIIYYHLTSPLHPKFVMTPKRKISLITHMVSGITEIVFGVAAFFITDQSTQQFCAVVMSIGTITHALTAYYQTGVVFGAKGIMVPGYLYAITIHIVYAIRLFLQPTSFVYLYVTYLTLHIYVWCRVFVFLFVTFSAFVGYHYTLAITLSGCLLFPYSMGPIGNFGFFVVCLVYCCLQAIFSRKTGSDLTYKLFVEHERFALLTSDTVAKWKDGLVTQAAAGDESDLRMAREVFDFYDTDKSGKLGVCEISNMVKALNIPSLTALKIIASAEVSNDGNVEFDEFYRFVWNVGTVKDRLVKLPKSVPPTSPSEQAQLVFDMLDVDNSGYIDVAELQMLLTQWGMPEGEAHDYLTRHKQKITYDTFHQQLQPIWQFGISQVFQG